MYEKAGEDLQNGEARDYDSDCQILEEKCVSQRSLKCQSSMFPNTDVPRATVISCHKRPAADSLPNPRNTVRLKLPTIDNDDEFEWPSIESLVGPKACQFPVKSYVPAPNPVQLPMNAGQNAMPGQSNQPQTSDNPTVHVSTSMNQPNQSYLFTCSGPPQNIDGPTLQTNPPSALSCSFPSNSSMAAQMNLKQEVFIPHNSQENLQQAVSTQPDPKTNQEINSTTSDSSPLLPNQDTNLPQASCTLAQSTSWQGQSPATVVAERRRIWQGTIDFKEKTHCLEVKLYHPLTCAISVTSGVVNAEKWPSRLLLQLLPARLLEPNLVSTLKSAAYPVFIDFNQQSAAMYKLFKGMSKGLMGCVSFPTTCDVRIMIVFYMPYLQEYVGYIAHDQVSFHKSFMEVYKKHYISKQQQWMSAPGSSRDSSTESTINPFSDIPQNTDMNDFETVDNLINSYVSIRHLEHQIPQHMSPSTSQQAQIQSTSFPFSKNANNPSNTVVLESLATPRQNTSAANKFETFDKCVNSYLLYHRLHHPYSQNLNPSISPRAEFWKKPVEEYRTRMLQIHPPSPLQCHPPLNYNSSERGNLPGLRLNTWHPPQASLPCMEQKSIESQAREIFSEDLVQKVVQKKLTQTGSRFTSVEELCDAILKYEESRPPKALEENVQCEVKEELSCKICMERQVNIAFEPCGHLATCQECAKSITICPICRSKVRKKMRIYLS